MVSRRIDIEARRQLRSAVRTVGQDLRGQRRDAGLSQRRVAAAIGLHHSSLSRFESGDRAPSLRSLARLAAVLGADLGVRLYPGTGPRLRDAAQAAMLDALLRITERRWRRALEVPIPGPLRGFIDAVLTCPGTASDPATVIAVEVQSEIRRLEEELRWAGAKARAVDSNASQLLVVRSTRAMRRTVLLHPALFEAAFPAPMDQALAALRLADRPWPGPALLWASIEPDGRAHILERPPRGIRLGR